MLLSCPNELLLTVADLLPHPDLSRLSRTCQPLHLLLIPTVHAALRDESTGGAVLRWAILNHRPDIVKLALDHGASEHQRDGYNDNQCSTIIMATSQPGITIVRLLLDHFGDDILNADDECHDTPLQAASTRGDATMVALLLQRGALVNGMGRMGVYPLSAAAYSGTPAVAQLLINAGADLSPDWWLGSPMAVALRERNMPVAKVLAKAGAEINVMEWVDTMPECEGMTEQEIRVFLMNSL